MTKKHYIQIAVILRWSIADPYDRSVVARQMADMFQKENPRFDRDKFYNAVGLEFKKEN